MNAQKGLLIERLAPSPKQIPEVGSDPAPSLGYSWAPRQSQKQFCRLRECERCHHIDVCRTESSFLGYQLAARNMKYQDFLPKKKGFEGRSGSRYLPSSEWITSYLVRNKHSTTGDVFIPFPKRSTKATGGGALAKLSYLLFL